MPRFTSPHAGHRARIPTYTCVTCMTQHHGERPRHCICGSDKFHYFPSKTEATRYPQLKTLEQHGKISCLTLKPTWRIAHNGIEICKVSADFSYFRDDVNVFEDVKARGAPLTRSFRLGRKLVSAFYGHMITVVEI